MTTGIDLLYHGHRKMDPEPSNTSLEEVARRLRDGRPTVAILEPGDATCYRLMLVWPGGDYATGAYLGGLGVPPSEAHRFLIVTSLDDRGGKAVVRWQDGIGVPEWAVTPIEANPWSQTLIAWWLGRLAEVFFALPPRALDPAPRDVRYLIWSHEHEAWWRPARRGYTTKLEEAGLYSFAEAAEITVGHVPAGEEVAVRFKPALGAGAHIPRRTT